jgi:hypothetical protein
MLKDVIKRLEGRRSLSMQEWKDDAPSNFGTKQFAAAHSLEHFPANNARPSGANLETRQGERSEQLSAS